MDCQQCHDKLLDYHRNLLDPLETSALEDHLGACPECAGFVRDAGLLPQILACNAQAPSRAVDSVMAMARAHLARTGTQAPTAAKAARCKQTFLSRVWGGVKTWIDRLQQRPARLAWVAATLLVLMVGPGMLTRLMTDRSVPGGNRKVSQTRKIDFDMNEPPPPEKVQLAMNDVHPTSGELEWLMRQKALARQALNRDYPDMKVMATLGGAASFQYDKLRGLLAVMTTATAHGEVGIQGALIILDVKQGLCLGPAGLGDLLLLRRVAVDRSSADLTKVELARDCLLLARPLKIPAPQGLQFYQAPGVADKDFAEDFEEIDLSEQPLENPQPEIWAVGLKENVDDTPWVIEQTELKQTAEGQLALADPQASAKWARGTILLDGNGELVGLVTGKGEASPVVVSSQAIGKSIADGAQAAMREKSKANGPTNVSTNNQGTTPAAGPPLSGAAPRIDAQAVPGSYQITLDGPGTDKKALIMQSTHPGIITLRSSDR